MKKLLFSFAAFLPAQALAHPGHGKPGFLHSHLVPELGHWVANGALVLYALAIVGVACWGLAKARNVLRKKARRDDSR